MAEKGIAYSRYIYKHETGKWPAQTIDLHHVVTRINWLWIGVSCLSALVYLLFTYYSLVVKGEALSVHLLFWLGGAIVIKELCEKLIYKESVMIFPAFGVQLETHYWSVFAHSGKVVRRFVPIDKILKPLLSECVTPVTCYWSLVLSLRDEDELMLVFKELRPPLKMLAPIWKVLCGATNSKESMDPYPYTTH